MTQQEAAGRLCVEPSSLSNWERGTRQISIDLVELDEALDGNGVLKDLIWAYGTPEGLDPGHVWTKVFPGPSTPVWLWVRTEAPTIAVEGEWGVARIEREIDVGPNGAFVTVGSSVPDSPVVVHLSEPGWADFGYGELPPEVPGAPILDAAADFTASSADGPFMELFRSKLASEIESGNGVSADGAAGQRSFLRFVVHGPGDRSGLAKWPPGPEGIDAVERANFERLREARKLSLPHLADRLARLTDVEVGRDTLRRFESDVGVPHDPMLPIALDHVLGADGRLAVVELRSGAGQGTVGFPPYWRGPVWMSVEAAEVELPIVVQRGNWHRELEVDRSALLSFHWFDPAVPLRVDAPSGVRWAVGLGRRAGTEAANQNWVPISVDVAQEAIGEAYQAINDAFDRQGDGDGSPEDDEPGAEAGDEEAEDGPDDA